MLISYYTLNYCTTQMIKHNNIIPYIHVITYSIIKFNANAQKISQSE